MWHNCVVPPQRPPTKQDPRDSRIREQEREIERLREELTGVERDRDRWKRRSERLKKQLDAARRAGFRQAAPFAKDRPQGRGGRPSPRPGAEYGRQACRRPPARVDQTHRAAAPAACPDCGGGVVVARVATQYQEDLPVVRPLVRRFDIEVGHCSRCRRRVQGRHRLQTSDALGAASVQLGPAAVALVVRMHTQLGVPLEKVVHLLRTQFGITVTPGGLARVLHRTARQAAPTYSALCRQVRNSPVVTPDETGWRVGALRHWLWAFATPTTTVYAIRAGRGFDDAATVLGTDFSGVLVRDGWAPYRRFTEALHQTCLAHLLRRTRHLQDDHPRSRWVVRVKAVLQAALELRDRRDAGGLSDHGLATAPRPTARPTRSADREAIAAGGRRTIRRPSGHRIPRGVGFSLAPVGRRDQLARRTGHPARRRHPQGLRWQSHSPRRGHPAGAGQRRPDSPPTSPRPHPPDRRNAPLSETHRPGRTQTATSVETTAPASPSSNSVAEIRP